MQKTGNVTSEYGVDKQGIQNVSAVYWNLSTTQLYEEASWRREGRLGHLGPLVVRTGEHTGRSPNDRFIVREPSSEGTIWWGKLNRPMSPQNLTALHRGLLDYLQGKDLIVQDCFVGADPKYRLPIRVLTEMAWQRLFARDIFIQARPEELAEHTPAYTIIDTPLFHAIPEVDGTRSEVFIVLNIAERLVLIGGTEYAGEMKKSAFTILNYLLPQMLLESFRPSHGRRRRRPCITFFPAIAPRSRAQNAG